jgi:tetratricopeptide (TPR) repeat protein
MTASTAFPADLEACRKLLSRGQYEECLKQAGAEIAKNPAAETWPELKAKAELALGQYEQAQQTLLVAIPRNPFSIRLRWLAAQTAPYLGDEGRRKSLVAEIDVLARNAAWRYTQDPENLVTLAQFALLQGSDAKEVQNVILQRARKLAPQHRDPILAGGNLAL